jgi:hypothetical protein
MEDKVDTIELRRRFVSDRNLPIQVYQHPYFLERLCLHTTEYYEYGKLLIYITSFYDSNSANFLNDYYALRDRIIKSIEDKKSYKEFVEDTSFGEKYKLDKSLPGGNLYNRENDNHLFLSIDIKSANLQALRYYDDDIVNGAYTYDEFIRGFFEVEMTPKDEVLYSYFVTSKYTRQVIFGKLNAKRTTTIEKWLAYKIYSEILEKCPDVYGHLYSISTDEIIFSLGKVGIDIPKPAFDYSSVIDIAENNSYNINVRGELFQLNTIGFEAGNSEFWIYKKTTNKGDVTYKSIPQTYYPQVHKLLEGSEVKENDLVFYHENQLAKFLQPIKLIEKK